MAEPFSLSRFCGNRLDRNGENACLSSPKRSALRSFHRNSASASAPSVLEAEFKVFINARSDQRRTSSPLSRHLKKKRILSQKSRNRRRVVKVWASFLDLAFQISRRYRGRPLK